MIVYMVKTPVEIWNMSDIVYDTVSIFTDKNKAEKEAQRLNGIENSKSYSWKKGNDAYIETMEVDQEDGSAAHGQD